MAKVEAEVMEYAPETLRALSNPGLLLASLDPGGRPNAMAIGWGSLGVFWGLPIFVVPVRESRYTLGCIESTGDFTVNVLPARLADWAEFCGTVSGRDHDKFAEAGMTAAAGLQVKSPIIEECVINYECRTVHFNDVLRENLDRAVLESAYAGGDFHRLFFGEIVGVRAEDGARGML